MHWMKRAIAVMALSAVSAVPAAADVTFEQAYAALRAAVEKAEAIDTKMNVAVVDAGGNLKGFIRMDGAWLGSIDIAIKKARTARFFDMPTGAIGELSQPGGPLYNIEHSNDGLITFPGGLPLTNAAGKVIGAIGVSGSTVEDDHEVAAAGAAAIGSVVAAAADSPEEAVRATVVALKTALENLDIDSLADTFSDDFYHPEAGDKQTARQLLQMGMEMGYADGGEVSIDDMEIEIDGDEATVYPVDLSSPVGAVAVELEMKNENGVWRITTIHVDGL